MAASRSSPAPRRASARRPPARWRPTAIASRCWRGAWIASRRWPTSSATAPIAIEADVTDRDSIVAASQRVQDELGGADILVNNAGVMLLGPFSAELSDDYRRMIETNLLGAITTTEVFLDQLLADGGGDLINLSSVAGRTARPGNAVYAATKWGMNGWSESLRQQLQPDVRVIVIEPGAVATELTDHITHARDQGGRRADVRGRRRSRRRTSPRSSPSPSRARAACRSTRSSCAPPRRR